MIAEELPMNQQAPQRIGEVITSSTTHFTAGTYKLFAAPPFGSLVKAQTQTPPTVIYGLVYEICTSSREPGGKALVRGKTYSGRELHNQEIYDENPDLPEVLQTEFSVIIVGFGDGQERVNHYLPPQPPTIHYDVSPCSPKEATTFSTSFAFLRTVLLASQIPSDELAAATLRTFAQNQPNPRAYLIAAGKELARFLKEDYDRLTAIVQRIELGK